MKLRTISGLASVLSVAALASACSSGVDLDQIRYDFDHPSGSVSDKSGVMAATNQRDASTPAIALTSGGLPGQSGLTAAGDQLSSLAPMRLHARELAQLQTRFAPTARSLQGLDSDIENTCAEAPEAQAAFQHAASQIGVNGGSASAEYSIDVSSCSGGRMTGKLHVAMDLEVHGNASGGSFSFKINETFEDVCETEGEARCVNGQMAMEASMSSTGSSSGSMEMIAGWSFSTSWLSNGQRLSAETKGGLREKVSGSGNSGELSLEYLVYVKNAQGEEVSYVLTITAGSMGEATLSYRGSDGTLECQVAADGSGQCQATGANGMGTISWTAEEAGR